MDYDTAVQKYIELRNENTAIEMEAEKKVVANKETMEKLGTWLQLKAEKDGLDSIKTSHGTVFWTNGARCGVTNGEAFFDFVKANEAWELIERRASKKAVGDYIDTHKSIPPGVDYTTVKQINVRKK